MVWRKEKDLDKVSELSSTGLFCFSYTIAKNYHWTRNKTFQICRLMNSQRIFVYTRLHFSIFVLETYRLNSMPLFSLPQYKTTELLFHLWPLDKESCLPSQYRKIAAESRSSNKISDFHPAQTQKSPHNWKKSKPDFEAVHRKGRECHWIHPKGLSFWKMPHHIL